MAWPFTRLKTFLANATPKLQAVDLNSMQDAIAAGCYAGYTRIRYVASCNNATNVVIGPIDGFIALDAGTNAYAGIPPVTGTVTINSGFINTAWNYIYAKATNGVVAYAASSTAPESTLRYKTGDESSRYICCVYVSSYAPRNFFARDGRYIMAADLVFGSGITAYLSWTALSMATFSPPIASRVTIKVENYSGAQALFIRPYGSSTTSSKYVSTGKETLFTTWTTTSQQIEYKFASSGAAANLRLDGWEE